MDIAEYRNALASVRKFGQSMPINAEYTDAIATIKRLEAGKGILPTSSASALYGYTIRTASGAQAMPPPMAPVVKQPYNTGGAKPVADGYSTYL
jgi:hypothetical protein